MLIISTTENCSYGPELCGRTPLGPLLLGNETVRFTNDTSGDNESRFTPPSFTCHRLEYCYGPPTDRQVRNSDVGRYRRHLSTAIKSARPEAARTPPPL